MSAVDEVLLRSLERFTAADAPFAKNWRNAVCLIERDLATEQPELDSDALDTPEMHHRLTSVTDRWRSLLCDDDLEHQLRLNPRHAGLLSAIDNWLTSWETT